MPAPKHPFKVVLRPEALNLMAEAIGDEAMTGFGGQPSQRILLGHNTTGTASALISGRTGPSAPAIATIAARYAKATGLDVWDAAREMFAIVPADAGVEADAECVLEAA